MVSGEACATSTPAVSEAATKAAPRIADRAEGMIWTRIESLLRPARTPSQGPPRPGRGKPLAALNFRQTGALQPIRVRRRAYGSSYPRPPPRPAMIFLSASARGVLSGRQTD